MTPWSTRLVVLGVNRNRKYDTLLGLHENSTLSITLLFSKETAPRMEGEHRGNKINGTGVRIFEGKSKSYW